MVDPLLFLFDAVDVEQTAPDLPPHGVGYALVDAPSYLCIDTGLVKISNLSTFHCIEAVTITLQPFIGIAHLVGFFTFKEEPKWNFVRLCMCYYYISLHNNREIYVQNASTS